MEPEIPILGPSLDAQRYFTPSEANAMLPSVEALIEVIKQHLDEGRRVRGILDALPQEAQIEAHERLEEIAQAARETLREIEAIGVHVKGIEPALVDFPALYNGREVYLCWKDGEQAVHWWHPIHTGYKDRERVDVDLLGNWEWCN